MHSFLNYLYYCSVVSIVVSIAVGIYSWQYLTLPFKLVFFQLVCGLTAETIGKILAAHDHNNTFLFNIYLPIELWFIGVAGILLTKNKIHRRLILIFLLVSTAVSLSCIIINGINILANWGFLIECVLLTIVYLNILINLLLSNKGKITQEPLFWFCISVIIYFGCNVPLFGLVNYLIKHYFTLADYVFRIDHLLSLLRYSFVAIAFLLCRKQYFKTKPATIYER